MFIKVTKSKNYHYLQLVESYREGGKNKHRVHANLGRFDQLEGNKTLVSLGQRLLRIAGVTPQAPLEIEEGERLYYGHIVYQKIWEKFKLSGLLASIASSYRIHYDLGAVIFYLVVHRLLIGGSKHKCYKQQKDFYGLEQHLDLQNIYRSLDILASNKATLEQQLFDKQRHLFNMKVDVVFYDLTTFHFESNLADDLRNFGYSKTGHFNEVQVVMGLLVDKDGRPKESFKVLKSTMKTRPIFHWTPQRIRGHFMVCFLAFLIERHLEYKLKKNKIDTASPEAIKEALNSLQLSEIQINNEHYYLKGKHNDLAAKILRILKIKQPKNLTPMAKRVF